jgi:hypothetical protein
MTIRKPRKPAQLSKTIGSVALLVAAWTCVSCGLISTSQFATMRAIRKYGRGHQATPGTFSNSPVVQTSVDALEEAGAYEERMTQLLEAGNYDQLDAEAQKISTGKDRLVGGGWELNTFYEAVYVPSHGSNMWAQQVDKLKTWVAKDPQSVTARVALANAYIGWGWQARGSGYSNSVSSGGWYWFGKSVGIAKATLIEVARLPEKTPSWYSAMQKVAQAEGWSREDEKELFDQAVAFEPSYYYFYQYHAGFLLPKWYGEVGETQAFINEVTAGIPEPDSSMLYFELSDSVACQCDPDRDTLKDISWEKAKEGYANIERLYGTVNVKNNRYAYMAYMAGDKAAAKQAFALIGDKPGGFVWHDKNAFLEAKKWAETP